MCTNLANELGYHVVGFDYAMTLDTDSYFPATFGLTLGTGGLKASCRKANDCKSDCKSKGRDFVNHPHVNEYTQYYHILPNYSRGRLVSRD